MIDVVLGIIGGSGIYEIALGAGDAGDGLGAGDGSDVGKIETVSLETPWGSPSAALRVLDYAGKRIVFLPRHGVGHSIPPSEINYRANIDVLKRFGVTDIISVSACGSLRSDYAPGDFVLVDQFIDLTYRRAKSFFGRGCVAHISMAHPVSPILVDYIAKAAVGESIPHHLGGTYVAIEGPQFSSLSESHLYRQWGCDVIGMTNMPEAKLAREAEISYATVGMVTDYDSWHPKEGEIDIRDVLRVMRENTSSAQRLLARLIRDFPKNRPLCPNGSDRALEYALITPPAERDLALMAKLDAIAGRVLRAEA